MISNPVVMGIEFVWGFYERGKVKGEQTDPQIPVSLAFSSSPFPYSKTKSFDNLRQPVVL
jgi:hypothetical protein